MATSGPNSAKPTTGEVVAGVYNNSQPALVDGQACQLQTDINGNLRVTAAAGSTENVNITGINGSTPALSNPLPVELSDGTQALGTSSNPLHDAASAETSTVYNGSTALTPLFSTIVASASGATTIINAVASKKIRVLALQLVANAAVNVKWQSHATPTDITGLAYLATNGGLVLPFNPVGWFQTLTGEALDINLSGAVAVGGSITYVTV